jgi:hypothetical protein
MDHLQSSSVISCMRVTLSQTIRSKRPLAMPCRTWWMTILRTQNYLLIISLGSHLKKIYTVYLSSSISSNWNLTKPRDKYKTITLKSCNRSTNNRSYLRLWPLLISPISSTARRYLTYIKHIRGGLTLTNNKVWALITFITWYTRAKVPR